MNRTRRHWILIAGVAVAIGSGAALGQAAITRALDSKVPDTIISDIRMPGTDGLALLKQIKQRDPVQA